ncbi:acyltransferase [Ruminococcus sp.]
MKRERIVNRLFVAGSSAIRAILLKLRYGSQITLNIKNSFRGKLFVDIFPSCKLRIGKKLSFLGPLYLKIINGGNLKIGENCFFNRNCSISCLGNTSIGNCCTFANNIVIVDHDHDVTSKDPGNKYVVKDINIRDNVWIGANAVILKGVTIGEHAVIAAGSVVTSDVEEWSIYAGTPARKIKNISH